MIGGRVGTSKRPQAKMATHDITRGGPSRHWIVPPISGSCHTGHFVFGCDSLFFSLPSNVNANLKGVAPAELSGRKQADGKPKASRRHTDPQRQAAQQRDWARAAMAPSTFSLTRQPEHPSRGRPRFQNGSPLNVIHALKKKKNKASIGDG